MNISIVMTTYNGQEHIIEQMESIKNQTRIPDEVIILDDQSSDDTVNIIQNYIEKNSLENWGIKINSVNKGWAQNFFDGMREATGDIIFLSDQDDIWTANKINDMSKVMEDFPQIDVLSGNWSSKLEGNVGFLSKLYYFVEKIKITNNGKLVKQQFRDDEAYDRPGWTYCYRNTFFHDIEKYYDGSSHDGFLCRYSVFKGSFYKLNVLTGYFRRHVKSTTSYDAQIKMDNVQKEISLSDSKIKIIQSLINYLEKSGGNQAIVDSLKIRMIYFEKRKDYIRKKSIYLFMKVSYKYWRYSNLVFKIKDFMYLIRK
ncbi:MULTISPECIES: glycosyltransferase [Lactococcus]|nr:glycosyltransferase [Lactococcus lactis]AIS02791.1 hypothetical protein LG36_0191 [Lactococcus lactis]MDG4970926.1 glycosyltransferase [Lactococcus lactis]